MRLQAERSASFNDFTDMMHQLLKAAWGNDWGTFTEDYPNGRDAQHIELPMITYSIKSKVPGIVGKDTREIKPRFRQVIDTVNPPSGEAEKLNIYSQVFDYHVEFEMWADTNSAMNALCERFEEFMMIYSGYFLQQGVQQLIFLEMAPPFQPPRMDDKALCRIFKYLVRLERQVVIPTHVIKEVTGKIGVVQAFVSLGLNLDSSQDQDKEAIDFRSK
jgi:hypothetical protein